MSQAIAAVGSEAPDVFGGAPGELSMQAAHRWFLVFTKPSGEQLAKANLERQGFQVYYPRLQQPSLYRGRWVERIVSLFPRYLFLRLDTLRQSLAPVRSTLGVANIVRFGLDSTTVPDAIVADLMRREDPETGLHKLAGAGPFKQGARVTVVAGAFEGFGGIFEREAGDERVVILLKLLGQDTPVKVPSRYVMPAQGN
jgi:transcriptional antiterminator RfaH